jgi:DNA-binding SARP family transcriptional activator/TolB-like protein
MIELRTLGALELVAGDGTTLASVLTQPRRAALLCYLALESRHGFLRRDLLYAMFWPEHNALDARHALRQSLYFLRHALGAGAIVSRGDDDLALAAHSVRCDAREFEEAAERGALEAALTLYRGDLLPGFYISNAADFNRWLDDERVRLRHIAARAAGSLAESTERDGDFDSASQWCRRAVALSPGDEAALRRLVLALNRLGDTAAAVNAFEEFAHDLQRAYELEPSEETRALMARIRAGGVRPEATRPSPAGSLPVADVARGIARDSPGSSPPAVTTNQAGEGPSAAERRRVPRRWYSRVPRIGRTAAAAAILLVIGGTAIVAKGRKPLAQGQILVMPLENLTGDTTLERVGQIAAHWIVQGLTRTTLVDVVPSADVSEKLRELQQGTSGNAATDAVWRTRILARAFGAGTTVSGSYARKAGNLDFQVQVVDISRNRIVGAVDGIRGPISDPMAAIDELRRKTIGAVAFRFDTRIPPGLYTAIHTPSYEAYQAFAVGEELRNRFEWRPALAYFRKAYALDTSFSTALLLAFIQHLNLREFAEADSLTRLLERSRERLPPVEQQILVWAEAKVRGDLEGVLEATRGLVDFGEDFRGQVAADALDANHPREAVEAISVQRKRLVERRSRMWELSYSRRMTEALHRLGHYERELAEAEQAETRNPGVVEPVLWGMRALIGLGRIPHAWERMKEALAMRPDPSWPAGEIMLRTADELRTHGRANQSRGTLLKALAWYAALPDSEARLPRHRRYRASALLRADSLDTAEREFRALAVDSPEDPYYMGSVGVLLARRGEQQAALDVITTALLKNPPYDFGHHVYERARIVAQLGNADEAMSLLHQAVALGFRLGFVGGIGGTARQPDGGPHLDPAFDRVREHAGFQVLSRGKD